MNNADIVGAHPLVLITGANSLLGTHVVLAITGRGYPVRALVRRRGSFSLEPHPGIEVVEGDFTDEGSLPGILTGCGAVIHVAACTGQGLSRYEEYHRVNVEATRKLLAASKRHGVKKFVYVSTANCFGFGSEADPGDETRPACHPFTDSYYARSKQQAQRLALDFSHSGKMQVVVVNPTFMLGPYGSRSGSNRIVLMGCGKVVFCPPGGKNFVHANDVADGVVRALARGVAGEAYLLCGENLSYTGFFHRMRTVTGSRPLCVTVPRFVLLGAGLFGNLLRTLGVANNFTLANMRILCVNNYYSGSKATTELGFSARPIEHAIADTLQWFGGVYDAINAQKKI